MSNLEKVNLELENVQNEIDVRDLDEIKDSGQLEQELKSKLNITLDKSDLSSQIEESLSIQKGQEGNYLLLWGKEKIGYVSSKDKFDELKNEISKDFNLEIVLNESKKEQKKLKKTIVSENGLELKKMKVESLSNFLNEDLSPEIKEKIKEVLAVKLINNPEEIYTAVDKLGEDYTKNKLIHNYFLDTEGFMEEFMSLKNKYSNYENWSVNGEGLTEEEKKEVKEKSARGLAYKKALINFYSDINNSKFEKIFLDNFYNNVMELGEDLEHYSEFSERVEKLEGEGYEQTIKERGIVGALHDIIDGTKMGKEHSEMAKGLADLAPLVGGIYAAYKAFSEYGFIKTIGGLLAGEFGAAALTGHGLFDWVRRISYGGAGEALREMKGESTEKVIEAGESSEEKKEKVGPVAFVGMIFGDSRKMEDIKNYLDSKNGKLEFDLDSYVRDLPEDDWRKIFIEKLKENHQDSTISGLVIQGLNKLGIDSESYNEDRENVVLGTLIDNFREKIEQDEKTDEDEKDEEKKDEKKKDKEKKDEADEDGKLETNIETVNLFEQVGYVEDGQYYMLGENGEPQKFEYSKLSPEVKEKLEKQKEDTKFIDDIMFLIKAYEKTNPDSSLSSEIQQEVQNGYINPDEDIKTNIKEILKESKFFEEYREKDNILNPGRSDNIFKLEGEARKEAIYKFVRNELEHYEMVSSEIAKEKFEENPDFSDEDISTFWGDFETKSKGTIIADIQKSSEGTYKKIHNFLNGDEEKIRGFVNDLYEKYQESQEQLNEKHDEIVERVDNIIENRQDLDEDDREKIIENIENIYKTSIFDLSFKKYILNHHVQNNEVEGNLALYKDIEGVGRGNFSDSTLDWGKEIGTLLLTEAIAIGVGMITVGAGFYVVNTAVWGTRLAKWGSRFAKWAPKATKFARGVGRATIEGVGFYQGMNMVHNVAENRDLFEGALDMSENIKSIAMMGALRGLGKLTQKIPGIGIKGGEGGIKKSFKLASQIGIEGITLGAGLGSYDVVVEGGEWDRDMLIEGLLMAAAFRLMDKGINRFNIRKNNGRVELYRNSRGREIEYKYDSKTGEIKEARYRDTGEKVSEQRLNRLKQVRENRAYKFKVLSAEDIKAFSSDELARGIKEGSINVKELSKNKMKAIFNKLTGKSEWSLKPFSRELRDLAFTNKKEFGKKIAKTVAFGTPNASLSGTGILGKIGYGLSYGGFAGITWFPQLCNGMTGGWENVDWSELAEDYTGYAILNRYISVIYLMDEMAQKGIPPGDMLTEFTSNINIPPERFDKASSLPGIGEDLSERLKDWGSQNNQNNGPVAGSS